VRALAQVLLLQRRGRSALVVQAVDLVAEGTHASAAAAQVNGGAKLGKSAKKNSRKVIDVEGAEVAKSWRRKSIPRAAQRKDEQVG
jgi:hypothetical protein